MPAPGQINPERLPARITSWLQKNPGQHRARDVANGLGLPEGMAQKDWSQKVGNALGRLHSQGAVAREDTPLAGSRRPVGVYSAVTATV